MNAMELRQQAAAMLEQASAIGAIPDKEFQVEDENTLRGLLDARDGVLAMAEEKEKETELSRLERGRIAPNDQRAGLASFLRNGTMPMDRMSPDGGYTLRETVPANSATMLSGGDNEDSVVQDDHVPELLRNMKRYNAMEQVATVRNTATGGDLIYPVAVHTDYVGEIVGEGDPATGEDLPFGNVVLKAHKYSSKVTTVSLEMLQDTVFDLEAYVRFQLAERIGRITALHFTRGRGRTGGNNEPLGLALGTATQTGVARPAISKATASFSVDYDDIVDLITAVDGAYISMPGVGFMGNRTMLGTLMKIKDNDDRPIFQPITATGFTPGRPQAQMGSVLNYPFYQNDLMQDNAANTKPLLFGDYSCYVIRRVMEMEVFRLREKYIERGMIGFLAFARFDGAPILAAQGLTGRTQNNRIVCMQAT